MMRRLLLLFGLLAGGLAWSTSAEAGTCPLPYNLINGVIYDATQVMADLNALAGCITGGGTLPACSSSAAGLVPATGGGTTNFLRADCSFDPVLGPYDIALFWPGTPPASQIVRQAFTRAVTCPAGLTGSVAIAKEAATAPTTVTINQVTAGTPTAVGSIAWAMSGTVGTFTAASPIAFAAADIIEFVFPGTPDATLGDIAVTLSCARS